MMTLMYIKLRDQLQILFLILSEFEPIDEQLGQNIEEWTK